MRILVYGSLVINLEQNIKPLIYIITATYSAVEKKNEKEIKK